MALIAIALLFDFINGMHDAANSIATIVSTRVLRPQSLGFAMSALGHVWTAPSWQELSSRKQHWSVQPCVRP